DLGDQRLRGSIALFGARKREIEGRDVEAALISAESGIGPAAAKPFRIHEDRARLLGRIRGRARLHRRGENDRRQEQACPLHRSGSPASAASASMALAIPSAWAGGDGPSKIAEEAATNSAPVAAAVRIEPI